MSRFAFKRTETVESPAPLPAAIRDVAAGQDSEAPPSFRAEAAQPAPPQMDNAMLDMRLKLHGRLIEEIDLSKLDKLDEAEMRRQVRRLTGDFARAERLALNTSEIDQLGAEVYDEMVGLGPIEPLLGDDSVDGIVGFWRVTFVSKGTPGVPDGTVLNDGFQQWHSDGTEFHWDAGSPPAGGNFCLGIWKKTGRSHYALNHFFQNWDPTNNSLHNRVKSVKKLTWTVAAMNTSGPLRSITMIPQGTFLPTSRARCTRPVSP